MYILSLVDNYNIKNVTLTMDLNLSYAKYLQASIKLKLYLEIIFKHVNAF